MLPGFFLVINGADGLGVVVVHDVDLGPVVSTLCISTRFVLLHPFPAFFLSVALKFAKKFYSTGPEVNLMKTFMCVSSL